MTLSKRVVALGVAGALFTSLVATSVAAAAPTMAPLSGDIAGGTVVNITGGSGYTVGTTVKVTCSDGTVNYVGNTGILAAGTGLTFNTPACAAGLATVETVNPATVGLPGFQYTQGAYQAPTLTPNNGKNGTTVTANYPGQDQGTTTPAVTVNGATARVIRISATSVTFAVPSTAAGDAANGCPATGLPVTVAVTIGTVVGVPGFTCNSLTATVSVLPTAGPTGSVVTLTTDPQSFDSTCIVTFNAAAVAVTGTSPDGSSLTFIVPTGVTAAASYPITVAAPAAPGGTCPGFSTTAKTLSTQFYVTSSAGGTGVSPTTVAPAGGTVVTISGLTAASQLTTKVYFTGQNALPSATNPSCLVAGGLLPTTVAGNGTSVTFVMPAQSAIITGGTNTGACTLANNVVYVWASISGAAPTTGTPNGSVTYQSATPPPVITSITPASGGQGASITLVGTGFQTGMKVAFGSVQSPTVTVASATSATVIAPAGQGTVAVTAINPDGQSFQLPLAFTFTTLPGYTGKTGTQLGCNASPSGTWGIATLVIKAKAGTASGNAACVTYRFAFGAPASNSIVKIWWAKKNSSGVWSAFTAVTSRYADVGGNAYWNIYPNAGTAALSVPAWISVRGQFGSVLSQTVQTRWVVG